MQMHATAAIRPKKNNWFSADRRAKCCTFCAKNCAAFDSIQCSRHVNYSNSSVCPKVFCSLFCSTHDGCGAAVAAHRTKSNKKLFCMQMKRSQFERDRLSFRSGSASFYPMVPICCFYDSWRWHAIFCANKVQFIDGWPLDHVE